MASSLICPEDPIPLGPGDVLQKRIDAEVAMRVAMRRRVVGSIIGMTTSGILSSVGMYLWQGVGAGLFVAGVIGFVVAVLVAISE